MRGTKMKLYSLEICNLYGCYNYNVKFNPDITFLYGANGCGKTTILNIIEAIITGQLFNLFNYKFSKIILCYYNTSNQNNIKSIEIIYDDSELEIYYNSNKYNICFLDTNEKISSYKNMTEISHYYFSKYEFLYDICKTFNHVYLPLNRFYSVSNDSHEIYPYRIRNKQRFEDDFCIGNSYRDTAMERIEGLIYTNYSRISNAINRINDIFRDNILKSQIELKRDFELGSFFTEIENNNVSDLRKTQTAYIKILKELDLINKSEEESYNNFFEGFIESFSKYKKKFSENHNAIPINLLLQFQEITKIKKTVEIAEKMESRKASVKKPIEIFLNTMNSFIGNDNEKEICIDNDGYVYFNIKHTGKKISIHHLSSGEKQLITFFANLIFNVDSKKSGIFVVDEPELSLHLSWQKIFVDQVLEIDKNIQLIFATHAPEIIGKRRNKMYRLDKTYVGDII